MVSDTFIFIAVIILAFGMVSKRIRRTPFSPAMFFVGIGLICGGHAVGLMNLGKDEHLVHLIGEITLILVLFTDASRIDLGVLRSNYQIPARLLAIGLPLTIVAGAFAALFLFPGFSIWEAAILAAILAPTDAALGQPVVSSPKVPVRIRQALNVESGINDGVCLPVIVILLATSAMECQPAQHWTLFTIKQLVFGPLVGIAIGYFGGKMVSFGSQSGWMSHAFQQLSGIGLALLCYAVAEKVGGNGFIAAFVGGLVIGNSSKPICDCLYEFGEAEGELLIMLVFLLFGIGMVWPALQHANGSVILYAVLSLTIIRMVPVALSLLGSKLTLNTFGFLGWFGPRGIASILFGLLVLENEKLHEGVGEQIFQIVTLTVFFSVIAHGITAWPGANWYGKHSDQLKQKKAAEEHQPVEEMKVRGAQSFD